MNNQMMKIIGAETLANEKEVLNVSTEIFNLLRESKSLYPEFYSWYFGRFVQGLREGTRRIIVSYVNGGISGVALIKNDGAEKKICCVKVNDKYKKRGIGIRLFGKCFELLDTTKPMITVADERLNSFSKIFEYYGFKLEEIQKGYYRENSNEYVFNGSLDPAKKRCTSDMPIIVEGSSSDFAGASYAQGSVCRCLGGIV